MFARISVFVDDLLDEVWPLLVCQSVRSLRITLNNSHPRNQFASAYCATCSEVGAKNRSQCTILIFTCQLEHVEHVDQYMTGQLKFPQLILSFFNGDRSFFSIGLMWGFYSV
jgi:hypothetical protein